MPSGELHVVIGAGTVELRNLRSPSMEGGVAHSPLPTSEMEERARRREGADKASSSDSEMARRREGADKASSSDSEKEPLTRRAATRADRMAEEADREPRELQAWPCAHFIAHILAIVLVVFAVVCAIAGFVIMVIQSVVSLQDHWADYKKGARNITVSAHLLASRFFGGLPKEVADELSTNALQKAEAILSSIVTELVSSIHRCVFEFFMMALYIFFWLLKPMPVWSSMEELFKRYIVLKTLACAGYGICAGMLLWALDIDLAAAFGLAAFFLSFIPEVGPIVAILLPTPVILFDGRLEAPLVTYSFIMGCQMALKFLFANIVEVKLVEADQLMKMHPVIILLAIAFFGFIWGPTGMLLSVPLVAIFKVALLSERVPALYRDPLLVVLEGDTHAPANHAGKRRAGGSVSAA